MSRKSVLLLYASDQAHVRDAVERLRRAVAGEGLDVEAFDVDAFGEPADSDYEAVVLGTTAHTERPQQRLARFIRSHRDWLDDMPVAFFTAALVDGWEEPLHPELSAALAHTQLSWPAVRLSDSPAVAGSAQRFSMNLARFLSPVLHTGLVA